MHIFIKLNDIHQFNLQLIALGDCPKTLGDEPMELTSQQGHYANAFLDFKFHCRGHVTAWRYFRVRYEERSAFVTIWRMIDGANDHYKIISKTELPPSHLGLQTVTLAQPIPVERDDFIGTHYTDRDSAGFLSICPASDPDCVPPTTLYQVFQFQVFDEELTPGFTWEIKAPTSSRAVALQAIMTY